MPQVTGSDGWPTLLVPSGSRRSPELRRRLSVIRHSDGVEFGDRPGLPVEGTARTLNEVTSEGVNTASENTFYLTKISTL